MIIRLRCEYCGRPLGAWETAAEVKEMYHQHRQYCASQRRIFYDQNQKAETNEQQHYPFQ